jgi:chorismate mutase
LLTTTEVANAQHVDQVLKSQAVDIIWLGARTVTNPFSVQEIAEALRGVDIPVMVKNPLHPDLKLWIGAIERLYKVGLNKIVAIHRGFYPFQTNKLRNIPKWEIPINLKTQFPQLPVIGDPSHIAGDVCYIQEVAQKALDISLDGLMIEVHINPKQALSDAKQQLTPDEFKKLINKLKFRTQTFDPEFLDQLATYRHQIDSIDYQILELLAQRMDIVKKIGLYKNKHNIAIFQLDRWRQIQKTRLAFGSKLGLNPDFLNKIMELIHKESINVQSKIQNNGKN